MNKYQLTKDQWFSLIRSIVMLLSGILVSRGLLSQTDASNLVDEINKALPTLAAAVSVLAPIIVAVWGIISHTMASKIKSVAANPNVEKIVVARSAPVDTAAVTIAKDPTIPKVAFGTTNGGPKSVN